MAHAFAKARYAPLLPAPATASRGEPSGPGVLECLARVLDESEDYRVLRRLAQPRCTPAFEVPNTRLGLVVDVETTGLDADLDEVVEVAAIPFRFAASGRIVAVHEPFSQLRQPSRPIPAQVSAMTGITAETVAGRTFDEAALLPTLRQVELVVAHNAVHDRQFLERLCPAFGDVAWACSFTELPWHAEGINARSLPSLATNYGFFYDAHRALGDCWATLEILGRPLPLSGRIAMAELVRSAASETCRIWAVGAPYEAKDAMRRRGYRWSNGSGERPRAWFIDVEAHACQREQAFLRTDVFGGQDVDLPVTRLTARERFSARA